MINGNSERKEANNVSIFEEYWVWFLQEKVVTFSRSQYGLVDVEFWMVKKKLLVEEEVTKKDLTYLAD